MVTRVSIVIPTFNKQEFLSRYHPSVLKMLIKQLQPEWLFKKLL